MKNKTNILFGFFLLAILLTITFGESCIGMGSFNYENPLTVNSFSEWFRNLLVNIQGVVGWLAVIMIVVGGVIYITAGGSVRQVTLAKSIIIFALVGFAIAVAAPSLLREIGDIATTGAPVGDLIATATPVPVIIGRVMDFLLSLIGMLALLGFIWGGIMFLTSGGDANKAQIGKRAVFYSIIAISISGAALIILNQILEILDA
jgi:hypothetical protein